MEEVYQHIQEMLDGGAIRPSQSPWCNAVVLVQKKDGTLRFCIDFRHLNARTKKDLQQFKEYLDATGHCWVSALAGFNFRLEYLHGADK